MEANENIQFVLIGKAAKENQDLKVQLTLKTLNFAFAIQNLTKNTGIL